MSAFRYGGYSATESEPNVVIDGSPNDGTVLTLTHWPGYPQPAGYEFDLSAEMAFHYLDAPLDHAPAEIVTNNHFDQDGLVGLHALIEPQQSLRHRELLIDVAAAGDFAKFRDRRAARASMTIDAYADVERSPIAERLTGSYDFQCVALYEETIPLLVAMATDNERFHELWADEDAELTASEQLIADGTVMIEEIPEIDLAVVTIPANERSRRGHRFAGESFDELHPMALHNATDRLRLFVVHGRRYSFVDRYETWVQYRSRPTLPRVDMRPLAERLMEAERGSAKWTADRPGSLTPTMRVSDESSLDADVVRNVIVSHLADAPGAWDPYSAVQS
jgi:hypothetical protein